MPAGRGLTIEDLVQLPRPGSAVPNPRGNLALWPSTTFSLEAAGGKGRTAKSVYLVDIENPGSQPREILTHLQFTEVAWLDDSSFVYLRPSVPESELGSPQKPGKRQDHPQDISDDDQTKRLEKFADLDGGDGVEIWAFAVDKPDADGYRLATLPVQIGDLKIARNSGSALLGFSATVFPDGDIFKVAQHKKEQEKQARGSDIRVYNSLYTRHWDAWKPTAGELKQLHFVRLDKGSENWTVADNEQTGVKDCIKVVSPLSGTTLECPVGPFGSADDYSFTTELLVFHAKDPEINPAWHTRTQVYTAALTTRTSSDAKLRAISVGTQGACSSPTITQDGKRVAWLEMPEDGYEADRNRVMIYEVETGQRWNATQTWDRSPGHIEWSPCGKKLFLTAFDLGRVNLFQLDVPVPSDRSSTPSVSEPARLTASDAVTAAAPLSSDKILVTESSFTSPNKLTLVDATGASAAVGIKDQNVPKRPGCSPVADLTRNLVAKTELSSGQSFWFSGSEGRQVHGYILFPLGHESADARRGKKLPLAFLVHGGPQWAWTDNWSLGWNASVYTAAGFITVMINPTGSTGYGQDFTDRIQNQWGGHPFQDLVAGLRYVQETYPEIDSSRMACLGASYGGFMTNWMEGHNDQCGFKAFVNHDGVFSTLNNWYTTEELFFPEREFKGVPWESENYNRWNPQNHISKWKTPMMVIHGGKDYRLLEGESLGVFNTLQRLGIPSRFLYFESENHEVVKAQNLIRWHEEVLKWLKEWTA